MISGRLRRRFTVTLSMVVVLFLLSALGVNQVLADDPVWLTVVGQWEYYDRDDTWVPAKTFNVKLYNYTTSQYLTGGYTDSNGDFELGPVENPGSDGVRVKIFTRAKYAPDDYYTMTISPGGTGWSHAFAVHTTKIVLNGTETIKDIGTRRVSSQGTYKDAFWIKDDLRHGFELPPDQPGSFFARWDYAGAEGWGNSFTHSASSAYIRIHEHGAEDTPDSVLHEMGHNVMYNAYGEGDWPPGQVPSPHFMKVEQPTEGGAWKEGWAHSWLLTVTDDPVRDYPGYLQMAAVNLETPTWNTPTWNDDGEKVEGRVAGALWDIYDETDDDYDTFEDGFSSIWATFSSQTADTFAEFWDELREEFGEIRAQVRPALSLYQSTIIFDPLLDFEVELVDGWNTIGLGLEPPVAYTASTLAADINSQGGSITQVFVWDAEAGAWDFWLVDPPYGENFDIVLGKGYLLNNDGDPSTWTYEGEVLPLGPGEVPLVDGWNFIALPVVSETIYTASTMAAEINGQGGDATEVHWWDPEAGTWVFWLVVPQTGTDFEIYIGEAYLLDNDDPVDWEIE